VRCLSIDDLRAPGMVFDYIDGGAADEGTLRRKCDAFADYESGGCVVHYTIKGRIDRTLRVAGNLSTCVCFEFRISTCCVTNARIGLGDAALPSEPNAGDAFLYRLGVHRLPGAEYRP